MKLLLILALFFSNFVWAAEKKLDKKGKQQDIKVQAAVTPKSGKCDRESLGDANKDNVNLTHYNSTRLYSLNKTMTARLDYLKKIGGASPSAKMQGRIGEFEKMLRTTQHPNVNMWDEPLEVSKKMINATTLILSECKSDPQGPFGGVPKEIRENCTYIAQKLVPNLDKVSYWVPEFCKRRGLPAEPPGGAF